MKTLLPDALILLGAVLLPAAVWLVHVPAAIAVLGLECLFLGRLLAGAGSGRR